MIWSTPSPNQRIEMAWVNAGAGYSTTILKPSYQSGVNTTTMRSIPDVSAIAGTSSYVYIYCSYAGSNPWVPIAGTSVSTPIFAAIVSIADQQRYNRGKTTALTSVYNSIPTAPTNTPIPSNNIQNYLYKNILTNTRIAQQYVQDFNDILLGNDTAGGSAPVYNTGTGFDVATGIGSPNVTNLCLDLLNIP